MQRHHCAPRVSCVHTTPWDSTPLEQCHVRIHPEMLHRKGEGRWEGFPDILSQKGQALIQNGTKWFKNYTIQVLQEGPYNYRVTTATFASKGHEQVQTVQTLPRLASPHTGHVEPTWDHTPFSIAVAAYNIQEPKSQKSKISNHSVHSDTFRYIHILQGSLCKWNRSQQNWC